MRLPLRRSGVTRACRACACRRDLAMLTETARRKAPRKYECGEKPILEFHIGPTASGKSKAVTALYPQAYRFDVGNGGSADWMDGYEGESIMLMDEFRGELEFKPFKQLCGWDPCKFQAKGTMVNVLAKKFVFTSTVSPELSYDDPDGECCAASTSSVSSTATRRRVAPRSAALWRSSTLRRDDE